MNGRKFNIPEITLRSWEGGKISPSNKSLEKIIDKLKLANVHVEKTWLLEGIGKPPSAINQSIDLSVVEDLEFFSKNPEAIFLKIETNDYAPFFFNGCEICCIPLEDRTENLSLVVLEPHPKNLKIMRLFLTESGDKILVPIIFKGNEKAVIATKELKAYTICNWKK